MKVKIRFVPRGVAEYFHSKQEVELIDLPDGSRYRDLLRFLEERFCGSLEGSLLDSFTCLCGGVPIPRKLEEPVDPRDEVLVVTLALGG